MAWCPRVCQTVVVTQFLRSLSSIISVVTLLSFANSGEMFHTKFCIFPVKRQVLRPCNYHLAQRLLLQPVRAQSNATVAEQATETGSEWNRARPFEEIPTESVFAMTRSLLPCGKYYKLSFVEIMNAIRRDYGDIFLWPAMLGKPAMLLTHNPDDFEPVFRNEGIWPQRPGSETLKYHRSVHRADFFQGVEGIIATDGEQWGSFRSVVNPVLMQPKNVKFYLHKMSQVNLELIERIKDIRDARTMEVPATFEEELNRWTLESVSVVALDKQLGLLKQNRNNPEAKQLFGYLTEFFTLSPELDFFSSLWRYVPTPNYRRLMHVFDEIQRITMKYVNEAVQRLEQEQKRGVERPENEKSVLEKLLKMDKRIATVMAMDMLMAGVDTTTTTFTGLLLSLAKNPDKQEKLRDEVRQILPNKDSAFTESALSEMPYLRACRKEALRIYPLAVGNARVLQRDVVLSGYRVPKGTQVNMITSNLLMNEECYVRAAEFLPERWLRPGKETQDATACPQAFRASNPFIYLPFGFGPRSCIGRRIVEMEMELGAARLVRNFNIDYNYSTENAFKSLLINVPNIPLTFKFTDVE